MATEPIPLRAPGCETCGAALEPNALSCPSCRSLTRAVELEALAASAKEATDRGDFAGARERWRQALALLPPETVQHQSIQGRVADIDAMLAAAPPAPSTPLKRGAAGLASITALLLTKGKFLLLGLTKIGTLVSMFASLGVYWALYGWAFALGLVLSIYVHEMGHVFALRQYGIAADAPMFIPGLGAFIRLRRLTITAVQDARVGLAGPLYGLAAAAFSLAVAAGIHSKSWGAIAHFGAVINLFNLIPVWQLDGARGFHSLTQRQRWIVTIAAGALWMVSSEPMLLLIALGGLYRSFTKDAAREPDNTSMLQYLGLLVALTLVSGAAQISSPIPASSATP